MKKPFYALFIFLYIFTLLPITVYANSAEPPALIVLIENAPEDISISVISSDALTEGSKREMAWETYFAFYYRDFAERDEILLLVSGNNISYETFINQEYLKGYNSIVTLDFENQHIYPGKLLSRTILLVGLRIFLTLIIESLIFFIFGFREKKSWLIFLCINLVTQGMLNISISQFTPFSSYILLNLIFWEIIILFVEMIAFLVLLKEHKKLKRILYAITANIASLILGGYLITVLPV